MPQNMRESLLARGPVETRLDNIAADVTELQNTGVDTVAREQLDELATAEDYGTIV